jgi:hypothetical protein
VRFDEVKQYLDPTYFGLIQLKISSWASSTMAKHSHKINTSEIKQLVYNSDSEEKCTLNV